MPATPTAHRKQAMPMPRLFCSILAAIVLLGGSAAAQDLGIVELTTTRLSETTCMLVGSGGDPGLSIRDLRGKGETDDEIRAARPSQDYDAKYGAGFFNGARCTDMMLGVITK
jgi:hypothetical protein